MTIQHNKYPKIGQITDAMKLAQLRASYTGDDEDGKPIYLRPRFLPVLDFIGTVKAHGTNAAVRWDVIDGEFEKSFQSRNRMIEPGNDNAFFAGTMAEKDLSWLLIELMDLHPTKPPTKNLTVFGEWCGEGIQAGVALTELPKMFIIFAVMIDDEYVEVPRFENVDGIHSIRSFPEYGVTLSLNAPEGAMSLVSHLTQKVEDECPIGKAFNVSGIGEGIVWQCITPGYTDIWFKSKGQKHSKSKVRIPPSIETLAYQQRLRAAAKHMMDEARIDQGFEYMYEMGLDISRKNLGAFLKYVVTDCIAEEGLYMESNNIDPKTIGKFLSDVAKTEFFLRETQLITG